ERPRERRDGAGRVERGQAAGAVLGQRRTFDEELEDAPQVFDPRALMAAGAAVVRRASHRGQDEVAVADHDVAAVALRDGFRGVVLEHHVPELQVRVDARIPAEPLRQAPARARDARRERQAERLEAGCEVVLVGPEDPHLVTGRAGHDAALGGQHHGQGARKRALAAPVDADDGDLKCHCATSAVRNGMLPASSSVIAPCATSGSSSRKNSTHSRSRSVTRRAPFARLRRLGRPARGTSTTPESNGRPGTRPVTAAPASSRKRSVLEPWAASTSSQVRGAMADSTRRMAAAATYSAWLTRSMPATAATAARAPPALACQRARSAEVRPQWPRPHMTSACRTPSPPWSQRMTWTLCTRFTPSAPES